MQFFQVRYKGYQTIESPEPGGRAVISPPHAEYIPLA